MYFWNIKKLKDELIRDGLSQKSIFLYIIVYILFAQFFCEISFLFPSKEVIRTIDYIQPTIDLFVIGIGTYLCFYANDAGSGTQFAERYFSISFVVGMRFIALLVPLFFVGFVAIAMHGDTADENSISYIDYTIMASVSLWLIIMFWRIVVHINDVAKAAHA